MESQNEKYKTLSCPCLNVLNILLYQGGILNSWSQKKCIFNTCAVINYTVLLHACLSDAKVLTEQNLNKLLWIFWTEWVWEGGSDWYRGESASKQNTGRTESPLPYPSPETFLLSLDRELIQCKGRLSTT